MLNRVTIAQFLPFVAVYALWKNDPSLWRLMWQEERLQPISKFICHKEELEKLGRIYRAGDHLTRRMYNDRSTI